MIFRSSFFLDIYFLFVVGEFFGLYFVLGFL